MNVFWLHKFVNYFNVAEHFSAPCNRWWYKEETAKFYCIERMFKGKPETQHASGSTCLKLQLDDQFSSSHDDDANHKWRRRDQNKSSTEHIDLNSCFLSIGKCFDNIMIMRWWANVVLMVIKEILHLTIQMGLNPPKSMSIESSTCLMCQWPINM